MGRFQRSRSEFASPFARSETEPAMSRFALVALLALSAHSSAAEPKLGLEDTRYLEKLVADFLFDPTGAEWVTGEFTYYRVWGGTDTKPRDGWLVRGKGAQGNRVYFTDGESAPAPATFTGVDFVAACRARYAPRPAKETPEERDERRQRSAGVNGQSDVVLAAWLHKLGHDDLAARALAEARKASRERVGGGKGPDPHEQLRRNLAESAFVALVDAYMNRADEVALAHGTRLFKLYKDVAREGSDYLYKQAEQVLGELLRRKAAGRFGAHADRLAPNDLPTDPNKRIAALIGALDEVAVRQWGRLGGVSISGDWRVDALIACGEAAVPALLDAYETDTRLTRSVSFWRSYSAHRDVRTVRETVLVALEGILRVRAFEPTVQGAGYAFSDRSTHAERTAVLRRYWREYGKLPFDARMMKILTDPEASTAACREAALNLVALGHGRPTGWLGSLFANPTVKKFARPSAAEALIAVLDREWRLEYRMNENPRARARAAGRVEEEYLRALVRLGDERVTPILSARSAGAADTNMKRRYAVAAFRLGEPKPLHDLARAFETGALVIRPPDDGTDRHGRHTFGASFEDIYDLADLLDDLSEAATPAADKALFALGDPKHPHHKAARTALLHARDHWNEGSGWGRHPFWFALARPMLDDATETGRVYRIENGWLKYTEPTRAGASNRPDFLTEPQLLRDEARESVRDRIASIVSDELAGAPVYHVVLKDSELALKSLKEMLDRFHGRLRRLTDEESTKLGEKSFIPDIKPLNRAATADDVATGDAVFHLNGKGKSAEVALPAWITLKDNSCGLAVQAEIGATGATVYGVIFKHGMRTVPQTEVDKVEPVAKK
jgi:hypothetical protein